MNFPKAVASGFRNATDFKTRASRSEFWWFLLFGWIITNIAPEIDRYAFGGGEYQNGPTQIVCWVIFLVPLIALGVRRFHDTDNKGWWILYPPIIYVYIFIKGTEGTNRFGENPLKRHASSDASALELLPRDDPPQDDTSNDTQGATQQVNFPQAVASGFRNATDFKTRATRSEFLWFYLFSLPVLLVARRIDSYAFNVAEDQDGSAHRLVALLLLLPWSALGVRRFHDANYSGWWMLVVLLVLGIASSTLVFELSFELALELIFVLCLSLIKGTVGENRFGPDPLARALRTKSATRRHVERYLASISKMKFLQATALHSRKVDDFKSRATRSEFWWFSLLRLVIASVPYGIYTFPISTNQGEPAGIISFWAILLLLPSPALYVRRFHDINLSGGWVLFPYLILVCSLFRGTKGTNRFGPDPLASAPFGRTPPQYDTSNDTRGAPRRVNFLQAVGLGLRNYEVFSTRSTRSEFCWFLLFSFLAVIVAGGIDSYAFNVPVDQTGRVEGISILLLLMPLIALSMRRIHDTDHRGWWILVPLLVYLFGSWHVQLAFGLIIALYLGFFRGTVGENRFGPDPLGRHASDDASALELFSRDDPPQDDTSHDTPPA